MPDRPRQRQERPSTYFVQDRSNKDEITRLLIQDSLLTESMGGVLAEQPDPTIFQRILDVGCGVGGWLIKTARTYPTATKLVGIDISTRMIDYARTIAQEQHVSDRVEFHEMDALQTLAFPADYFDLVNLRLGWSYLRTWDWPKLIEQFQHITRPGGVVRLTECEAIMQSTSPALTRILEISLDAFYQAGHFFRKESDGVSGELTSLLRRFGFQNIQTHLYPLAYQAGSPEVQKFYEDMKHIFRNALPFYQKWTRVPDNFEEIYQQALKEMQQPDFTVKWNYLTVWGNKRDGRIPDFL
jgi:ubiquinone/menaquinone biosynthesis C-methylase UbiE